MKTALIQWAIGATIALAVVAGIGAAFRYAYNEGHKAGTDEVTAKWNAERATMQAEHAAAMKRHMDKQRRVYRRADKARDAIQEAQQQATQAEQTIRSATDENPSFFGNRRPDDVQRVRDAQLRAIESAARTATADLPE